MNAFPLTSCRPIFELHCKRERCEEKEACVSLLCPLDEISCPFHKGTLFQLFFKCGPFTLSVVYSCVTFVFCEMSGHRFLVHVFSTRFPNLHHQRLDVDQSEQ